MEKPPPGLLHFNGVNGATGDYGLPPMTGGELSQFVQGEAAPENLGELRFRHQQQSQEHYGVKEGVDPTRIDQSGWGVIFGHDADPAIREALDPLLKLRREQAGERFRLYEGGDGFRVGRDNKNSFLARHGAGPGPADPDKVPYYLLIVGSPETIPYRFQSQLDVQYAVGRLHFDDLRAYDSYARSVVAAETAPAKLERRMAFFGTANPDDPATASSTEGLITPLHEMLSGREGWQVDAFLGQHATKARLGELLGGDATPAFLFTGSHGMEFPLGDPRQIPHQGALLCQDWPGPREWRKAIPQDFYFATDDLSADASLLGLMAFHFACYGAGTPELDEFAKQAFKDRQAIAPHAFLAALPMGLLGHARGGALAVVGHVERAWTYSFNWPGAGAQTTVFQSAIERLLAGHPVGSAMEYFDERYAELSTVLSDELEEVEFGKEPDPLELAGMWTANNDARGYTILGDPAVRLQVASSGETPEDRPVIETASRQEPRASSTEPLPDIRPEQESPVGLESVGQSFGVSGAEGEELQFSAHHPRALEVDTWRDLLVYAHLETAVEAVKIDAGEFLGARAGEYGQSEASASRAIAPGTRIDLVPQGRGLEFQPPRAYLTWEDEWQRAGFKMRATEERAGHVVEGGVACYVGPLLIAEIRLPVVVIKPGEQLAPADDTQETRSAKTYRAVFASYSHDDTAILESVEAAYKALGMDYLRDVMTLKSGQSWSDELLALIERADIFQLFWSETASRSPYVEQEWRHALSLADRKGPAFVRPVYWGKPMPPVPEPLSHIHFASVDFDRFVKPGAEDAAAAEDVQSSESLPTGDWEDLKTLTVSTYTSDDPEGSGPGGLLARTLIHLDGDIETHLSRSVAEGEEPRLELHRTIVKEALATRLAYLELLRKGSD